MGAATTTYLDTWWGLREGDAPPTKTITNRMEVISKLVRGVNVLDLGVVDYRRGRGGDTDYLEHKPSLLYRQITEINPQAVGVDLDKAGIERLKSVGYTVEHGNVETISLDRRFDVIVAGEIIEHLENPGLFLRNMLNHINDDGRLVITTPNPFYAKQRHKIWRYNRPQVHEDHTCWFDPITLNELLTRTGWEATESYWVDSGSQLWKTWPRLFRSYFSNTFLIVAKPASA